MEINRRHTLTLLGSALAAPYTLRSGNALEPVQTVHVCSLYGQGFYYVQGSDIALSPGGYVRVGWTDLPNNSLANAHAYTRAYDLTGTPTSDPVQLGKPTGPTDGTGSTLVAVQGFSGGNGTAFFNAPRIGAMSGDSTEIYAQFVNLAGGEVGKPVQVNKSLNGGFATLNSAALSNGNIALGYTAELISGINLSMRVADPKGNPISDEWTIFAGDAMTSYFSTDIVANDAAIFAGFLKVANGTSTFGVQPLDYTGWKRGAPRLIRPMTDTFLVGSPAIIPGIQRDFTSLFMTTADDRSATLFVQHFTNSGTPGRRMKIGSHAIDNGAFTLFDGVHAVQLADGNIFALTDSVEKIIAWLINPDGQLLGRSVFHQRRGRRFRNRRLRRFKKLLAALFHEYDDTASPGPTSQWRAQLFNVESPPPPP